MTTKLNPAVITDDMMYESNDLSSAFVSPTEIDEWVADNKRMMCERYEDIMEQAMWEKIRTAAKTNSTLQAALDHAIMIYKLSKEFNT